MYNSKFKCIRRFLICLLTLTVIAGTALSASAAQVPYDGYTYWTDTEGDGSRKSVYSKAAFEPLEVIDSERMNTTLFEEITDFYISDKRIYILDGGASEITVLDDSYNVVKKLGELNYKGEALNYRSANGIFAKDGRIYVCDTENARVLISDENGNVVSMIGKPDSPIIPDDFQYRPIKLTIDSVGHLYILSEGSFYGALQFSPSQEFIGFFGANSVTNSISTVLSNIMSRVFPNNAKKAASARALPYSMIDLCMFDDDFVYTVTGSTNKLGQTGQIRKLFVGTGGNILENKGSFIDRAYNTTSRNNSTQFQDLCSIDIADNGFIYALDSKFGRVFVYDSTGKMLTAFGGGFGNGEQEGSFLRAKALALKGENLFVLDSDKNSFTVFKPTEFFKLLSEAQILTLNGDYVASQEIWKEVLALDSSCQLAYAGLARAEYAAGNYEQAKEYSATAYDRDTYSLAFKMLRTDFITKYFWLIMTAVIVGIVILVVLLKIKKRKGIKLIKSDKLRLAMSVLIHPIDTFTTIKEKRKTSVGISVGLLAIFYVTSVLTVLCGGFMFTYYDPASFNSLWLLVKSLGLVVLWIVANWLVCSLMGGNGRISEIITVTCYSLIPLILNQVIQIIFTNVLLPEEATFLTIISGVAYILFFFMLASGTMIIHDYEFGKFIGTSIITVLGMAVVLFLIFLIVMLFQQLFGFVSTVITEISTF